MDKTKENLDAWCSGAAVTFKSPEAEEAYKKRAKRITDAIQLKVPDRVPIAPISQFFAAKYAGITPEEAMYDYDKANAAWGKVNVDFEPDLYGSPLSAFSGPVFEALDLKLYKWPGHGVSPNHGHQYVEGEYMKADEYDAFLQDPSDFVMRTYLPRICGALESFKTLPPLRSFRFSYLGVVLNYAFYGMPEVGAAFPEAAAALESVVKAVREALKWIGSTRPFNAEMGGLGFPSVVGGLAYAPFDPISDYLRGMRGVMLDMYRQPDKLLEAIEKITPRMIWMGVYSAKMTGNPIVFIPLHRGAEGFMSLDQFKTFFWPGLQRLILGLIDEGLVPCVFWEGDFTSRLEIIKDIPKGKAIYYFDRADIFKAKEVLGDTVCIRGNVPASMLVMGTPQELKDYCKKLIDVVGKGGGFIMDGAIGIPDEANPELVKVWFDFTKEYGVYR